MLRGSVIIPTYNKLSRLKLVLFSLECQRIDKSFFEVIIIDDGSNDDTLSFLSSCDYSFQLSFIRTQNNGRSAARNCGILAARYDILIFIDDDTVLHPDFVAAHLEEQSRVTSIMHGAIRENPYVKFFADPCGGILYPEAEVKGSLKRLKNCCVTYEDIANGCKSLDEISKVSGHEKIVQRVFELNKKDWFWISFCGGNTSVCKKWLTEVGGFDESFGLNWGCEDMDVGYRMMKKKYPFSYNPQAVNYHLDHWRNNFSMEHRKNMLLFYGKYKDPSLVVFGKFAEGIYKSKDVIRYLENIE